MSIEIATILKDCKKDRESWQRSGPGDTVEFTPTWLVVFVLLLLCVVGTFVIGPKIDAMLSVSPAKAAEYDFAGTIVNAEKAQADMIEFCASYTGTDKQFIGACNKYMKKEKKVDTQATYQVSGTGGLGQNVVVVDEFGNTKPDAFGRVYSYPPGGGMGGRVR